MTVHIGCIQHEHRCIIITVQCEVVGSPTGPSVTIFGFKTKTTRETPEFVYVFQSIITYVKTIATYKTEMFRQKPSTIHVHVCNAYKYLFFHNHPLVNTISNYCIHVIINY